MSNTLKLALAGIPLTALVIFLAFRKAHQTPAVQVTKDRDVLDIREADTDFAWEQLLALRARKVKLLTANRPANDECHDKSNRVYLIESAVRTGQQPIDEVLLALDEAVEERNRAKAKALASNATMAEIDRLIKVQTAILELTERGRRMLNLPS